jgi:quercetin dioxygenase-like cupin family protein
MIRLDEWVEDPVLRQRLRFTHGSDPDGGVVLHVEMWVDPGGGVTPHVHPDMEERFHVLEGRCAFLAGREWREAVAGEEVVVAPGVRHSYANRSNAPTHVRCDVRPPSSLERFLEEVAALSRDGRIMRGGIVKPSGLVRAATVIDRHRAMVTLLFPPAPPVWLQRLLLPPLAAIGRRRGY